MGSYPIVMRMNYNSLTCIIRRDGRLYLKNKHKFLFITSGIMNRFN